MTLRVMLLSPYAKNTAGSLRYRWEQYIPYLHSQGIELDVRGFQSLPLFRANQNNASSALRVVETLRAFQRRQQDIRDAGSYDIVVVQREATPLGPPWVERALARRGTRLVYDFDDALYFPAGRAVKRLLGWSYKIGEIISLSHAVIAGNPHLANFARTYNDNVTIIPSVPYPDVYRVPSKQSGDAVVVGWSGGSNNSDALMPLIPVLRDLSKCYRMKLHVAGSASFQIEGVDVSGEDWTFPIDDTQVWNALQSLDIGLMPLEDIEWNRGKCGFKALLYMSMGIPPVVSPVGVNVDIVQDGVNGFLADTEQEWYDKLERLVTNPELRLQMSRAARRSVEDNWSAAREAPRLVEVLRSVAA